MEQELAGKMSKNEGKGKAKKTGLLPQKVS
jgi:hypothetical protein